ncbi:hypothetical protein A79E_0622 [Klebsiella pneumoniae subsp. pneumoniae 1084]|nr:hypothetical protein A79E_0622 [Klebsiella pneumoniae subsp. pneumoniae 1084]
MFDRLFSRSRQKISKKLFSHPLRQLSRPPLMAEEKKRASSHFHHILGKNVP